MINRIQIENKVFGGRLRGHRVANSYSLYDGRVFQAPGRSPLFYHTSRHTFMPSGLCFSQKRRMAFPPTVQEKRPGGEE